MEQPNKKEAETLLNAQGDFLESGQTNTTCPRCGSHLIHEIGVNWEITRCEVPTCIGVVAKGI